MQSGKIVSICLALLVTASCADVLGIDEATLEASTGGGTGSGGAGGAAADGGTFPPGLCGEYCASVLKNCTEANELYTSPQICLDVCKLLPAGTKDDTSGNTVGCRLHYSEEIPVVGERETNCPAAGPGGNGVCGTDCEGFCSIAMGACTGTNVQYSSAADCATGCATVPDPGGYNDSVPNQTGNSVQCRLYHASAASFDPKFHCPHTNINVAGPCSAP